MNALSRIKQRARDLKRRVVLPEGTEPRVMRAVKKIMADDVAKVCLLGKEDEVEKLAREHAVNLSRVEIVNPEHSADYNRYVATYMDMRKEKGMTEEEATRLMLDPLFFGAMMVRHDKADASVAGSVYTTSEVLKAALQIIGLKAGNKVLSSCFLMMLPRYRDILDKVFLYADAGVVPNPGPHQLAEIAATTAETMRLLTGEEPRVAFLSFSTKGSAKHADVDKVVKAFELFKSKYPDIKADGELQGDAAIVPEVARRKAPDSELAGDANVLIFPSLDSGNIAYKLTERLAGATAIGPIIQGLAKPSNDLSRGCTAQDIVDATAIAVVMRG